MNEPIPDTGEIPVVKPDGACPLTPTTRMGPKPSAMSRSSRRRPRALRSAAISLR